MHDTGGASVPTPLKGQQLMPHGASYDAVIVGSGPNGLAAAITLARAGRSALVVEASETIGGGCRSAELTLPGFIHDTCAAVHPYAVSTPFMRSVPLADYGVEWIRSSAALAHPLDDGRVGLLWHSLEETAAQFGADARAWQGILGPVARHWPTLAGDILGPLRLPRHPLPTGRFGMHALRSARGLVEHHFTHPLARAVLAGVAAHSMIPLEAPPTAAPAIVLGALASVGGWPIVRGGSQVLADALARYLRALGGDIATGWHVRSLDELPPARVVLCDSTPRQLLALAGDRLPAGYRRALQLYRYGPGVCKVDFALDGPIPWRTPECGLAATVHLGGTFDEIAAAERHVWRGEPPDQPFVLLAQPSLFDPMRAPEGKATVWAYCHVPNGASIDMSERIERQIERFAPGFHDRILRKHVMTARQLQAHDPNYVGGDITGGVQDLFQLYTRPIVSLDPYATPVPGLYLCSSSTPPGGGVHGLCGLFAARSALRHSFGVR